MRARGWVRKRGDAWYYSVFDTEGRCVFADNTGNWRIILDSCITGVFVADYVQKAGHRFKHSYGELVEKAAGL